MKKYIVTLHCSNGEDIEYFYDTEAAAISKAEDWFWRRGHVEVFVGEVEECKRKGRYVKQPGFQKLESWRPRAEAKERAYEKAKPEMRRVYMKYLRAELSALTEE